MKAHGTLQLDERKEKRFQIRKETPNNNKLNACMCSMLPSIGLGRKCAAGLVFLTLLPFMA